MKKKDLFCLSLQIFQDRSFKEARKFWLNKTSIKVFIIFFYGFCFTGCQVDHGFKKHIRPENQILNTIGSTYNPSIDILFIIDDSPSMAEIQDLLSKNAELFIDQFLNTEFLDYHIAVTSSSPRPPTSPAGVYNFFNTDPELIFLSSSSSPSKSKAFMGSLSRCSGLAKRQKRKYLNYVDRTTPKAHECLKEMMRLEGGATDEHFLDIPGMALPGSKPLPNRPVFYRPEAHLAVFIITDAHDQSNLTPEESYQFLLDLKKGDESKIHYAAGIITFQMLQYRCDVDDPFKQNKLPLKLMKMVELFDSRGYLFSLCQFNYGKSLAEFASHLVDSVLIFPFDRLPDVNTIEVRYESKKGSQLVPNDANGWIYDVEDNAIHLSRNIKLDKSGGKFKINYDPMYIPE